jgi:hypothetical protein
MAPRRPPLSTEQRSFWDANVYLVLPGFYPRRTVSKLNRVVARLWATRTPERRFSSTSTSATRDERRIYFRDAPETTRDRPYKMNDPFLLEPSVRQLARSRRLAALSELPAAT